MKTDQAQWPPMYSRPEKMPMLSVVRVPAAAMAHSVSWALRRSQNLRGRFGCWLIR